FNNLAGKSLQLGSIGISYLIIGLLLIGLFVGFASGSYPAFFLSSFKPVDVLKSGAMRGIRGSYLRNILVTFQFIVTIVLFICTIVVNRQMTYIQNKDLGFDKENLLVIDRAYVLGEQFDAFQQELLKNPTILQVSSSSAVPGGLIGDNAYLPEGAGTDETHAINNIFADWHFMETYGLELIEGRWFQEDNPTDSFALIINESAVRALGFEDPLNKRLYTSLGDDNEASQPIIGVIKDFNFQSLHQEIRPLVIKFAGDRTTQLSVRISGIQTGKTLEFIEDTWNSFMEEQPVHMTFLEEDLSALYQNDEKSATVFSIFSILAIFIASLGLFGLTLYNSQKRIREIGIRKVLGATETGIVTLVSKNVINAVVVSIAIALPAAFFITRSWLQDFPYNVGFQPLIFVYAAFMVVIIALITVAVTSLNAARTNPAICLHYE
ncbi:MAG: hypothetical protein KAT15_28140, partial [Bacteroidales bacterium]|nr:hypothetical protein [Bacteroidales bacterium]